MDAEERFAGESPHPTRKLGQCCEWTCTKGQLFAGVSCEAFTQRIAIRDVPGPVITP